VRHSFGPVHGELTTLPGCSQLVVSHAVFSRLRGHAVAANEERQNFAKSIGYDYMLCTVDLANGAQLHILERCGWKRLDVFKSSKTQHNVALYGRNLCTT
jgi:hypothetical protein